MKLDEERTTALARRALRATRADAAEAIVTSSRSALTRFAVNRIHQNVAEQDTQLTVRAVLGSRQGVASTNRMDEDGIAACAEAAVEAARHAPETSDFPGLPGGAAYEPLVRDLDAALAFDTHSRVEAAREIIEQSATRGLTAAGTVALNAFTLAVGNTLGVMRSASSADVRATVLAMHGTGGSGWASWLGADPSGFSARDLGAQAATTAERSARPVSLEPGIYSVVLAPEAVADLLDFMGYLGFGAKAYAEGGSFLVDRVGTKIVDERISVTDDARSRHNLGLGFDFEGQPRRRVSLIERGIAREPVTDSYYAAKLQLPNTGHALPAPNTYGPLPVNLEMAPGDLSERDMIASMGRGVYVTRLHYVNVEDPMKLVLTGMTRDGTFMIENGKITQSLKNLRFTQNVLEAFSHVGGIGAERTLVGPGQGAATLVPALLLERWEFTGQTG